MSDGRKPKFKEPMQDIELSKMKLEVESEAKPETPLTAEQIYLKRQAEVAQQDNEDFSEYRGKKPPAINSKRRHRRLCRNRRRRKPRRGDSIGAAS